MDYKPEDWQKVPLHDMPAFLQKHFPENEELKAIVNNLQRKVDASNLERFVGFMNEAET